MSIFLAKTYLNETTRLDSRNYENWKFKVLKFLEGNNLWPIVSGVEPKLTDAVAIPNWEKGGKGKGISTNVS